MQGLIARVISSVLGSWIQLQPDQLQVGLWSGNASFQSLEFNVDKLNGILHEHEELCNVRVMSAAIGKLEMKIPWRAMLLGDAPIEITIEKVAILLNRVDSNIVCLLHRVLIINRISLNRVPSRQKLKCLVLFLNN